MIPDNLMREHDIAMNAEMVVVYQNFFRQLFQCQSIIGIRELQSR